MIRTSKAVTESKLGMRCGHKILLLFLRSYIYLAIFMRIILYKLYISSIYIFIKFEL